ncbi:MAG: choice-of-anchor B family protein [Planctomycetes bacterium]|nr:choice-of-anchor B family protein [Planctomycetota bacterium]
MTASRFVTCLALTLGFASSALVHDADPKLRDKRPAYMGPGWKNAQLAPAPAPTSGPQTLIAPPVAFGRSNVALLSWMPLADFGVGSTGNGNSCTGYVSGSGREYAIFGHSSGTSFVEVTQPGNAQLIATIAGPTSLWRDMRTYSTYCYSVSEGGGGIQVINLANIDAGVVTLTGTVNDDGTSATHTITVDPVSGYLYRAGGGSNGLRIYDIHTNPANPVRVGTWNDRYVHEASVFTFTTGPAAGKQIAFCCGGLSGGFVSSGLYVVDVTNKASPVQTSFSTYANTGYCHQAWPSADMQFLYLDDELDDEDLGITSVTRVFSLANPLVPTFVGTFTSGSTAIDHNQYTRGDKLFQANYRSGLRVWQTSSPGTQANPVTIGTFDTFPEDDDTLFNGLWNIYPYFPSGVVIGSDIDRGLFVWWVGAPLVTFTPVNAPAFANASGQRIRTQIAGALLAGSAALRYRVDNGAWASVSMTQDLDGSWYASLPAVNCGAKIDYYVSAQSPNGVVWTSPEAAPEQLDTLVAGYTAVTPVDETFETATAGWTAGAAGDNATSGVWTRVNPNGTAAQSEDDHTPGAGTMCWVTGQGSAGGSAGAADVDGGTTTLLTPTFNLSGYSNAIVGYWRWFDNVAGGATPYDDAFRIDVTSNNGATWVNVETVGPGAEQIGTEGGWAYHEFVVTDRVPLTNQFRMRFVASDTGMGSVVEAAIDDFKIRATTCVGFASFCAGDGSSVACPCGNAGTNGAGCANSAFAAGGLLTAAGTASVAADTALLSASNLTGSTCVFFQGDAQQAPVIVDDGLGCVTGTVVRLGTKGVVSNTSSYPQLGDATISVRGLVPAAGARRYYQCFYRNAVSVFCPPSTSNRTNGVVIAWGP